MENRILTIMFTDIKGFTSRTATFDLIKKHRDLVVPLMEERGGKLIKSIGDAFLFTFESPTDAVLSGISLQDSLREYNAGSGEEERVEIRVAINTGEVLLEEEDVFGEAVNIASRIEGIAEPNDVYFTEATYLLMNKSEVPSAEIGYRILKGVPEKIKVYKVLREGETAAQVTRRWKGAERGMAIQRIARWRRIPAFAIDLALVCLLTLVLFAGDLDRTDKKEKRLKLEGKKLHGAFMEDRRADIIEIFRGRRKPEPDMAHYEEVRDFLRSRRENLGHPEKIPEMKRRGLVLLKKIQKAEGTFVRNEVLWGDYEIEPDWPHREEIVDFRKARDRLEKEQEDIVGGLVVVALGLFFLYMGIFTGWRGRTLGKKLLRLVVLRETGGRCGWGKGFLRAALYLVSGLPLFLGFLWGLFDGEGRAWHDSISKTKVVSLSNS